MLFETADAWLILFIALLLCEIYVPVRARIVMPFLISFFATVVFSEFQNNVFYQCVFCFCAVGTVYFFYFASGLFKIGARQCVSNKAVQTIVLSNIEKNGIGYVYKDGNRYIIKNSYERKFRKGELMELTPQELSGEENV